MKYFGTDESKRHQRLLMRTKDASAPPVDADQTNHETVSLPSTIKRSVQVHHVIVDSLERDQTLYPDHADFVFNFVEPLKRVFAIRLLRTELFPLELNDPILLPNNFINPLVSNILTGYYLYLNNYRLITRNGPQQSINMFARMGGGVSTFNHTDNVFKDPYTYICNPMEEKLSRLEVKLYTAENVKCENNDIRYLAVLAIYCIV